MKSIKVLTAVLAAAVIASTGFAQQANKTVKGKPVDATVIILPDSQNGGADEGLNSGLENFIGSPLKIKTVTRDEALKDPKYKGLNLDYMPLYLLKKSAALEKKFEEAIKYGQLKVNDDFIIFEKQTRYGVNVNAKRKPNVLEVFVMSQCPYGAMAEGRIIDAQKLGRIPKDVTIDVRYIVSDAGDGKFNSLHGTAEWEENVRQLIIKKHFPAKFWKYLEIRNKDYQSSLWDQAAEEAGINPKAFRKYWNEGIEMLKEEAKYSNEAGVSGSPTFLWEGQVTTDMNGLGQIKGLEGLAQVSSYGNPQQGGGAPQGQC